jgi:restriction system protein
MAATEAAIWGIHVTGMQGDAMFREKQTIGIGWRMVGNLTNIQTDREAYKAAVRPHFPNKPNGYVINAASQLFRFATEMKKGDWVVYRSSFDRRIYVGRISGEYRFDPVISEQYPNVRAVAWQKALPLTAVSQGALHELGSALTLFQLKNYGDEFIEATEERAPAFDEEDDESASEVTAEARQTTEDFVLRSLAKQLKGYPLQAFVANLLNTMGYRTAECKRGPDEGIDITAYRDELRLEPPIIKVQVKSTEGSVGRPDVQALLGCLAAGEYGLMVTLGSYTNQALDFAKSKSSIQLVDGARLVALVLAHYEELDPKFRARIPLQREYVPAPSTDTGSA